MSNGQALALCIATTITGALSLFGSSQILVSIWKDHRSQQQPQGQENPPPHHPEPSCSGGSITERGDPKQQQPLQQHQVKQQRQRERQQRQRKHALLLKRFVGMVSVADILATLGFILGVWFMPASTGLPFAVGNVVSCDVSGVLSNFLTAVVFCNCNLSFYYVWTVRRSTTINNSGNGSSPADQNSGWFKRMLSGCNNNSVFGLWGGWSDDQIKKWEPYLHAYPFAIAMTMMIVCSGLQGYNPRSLLRGCGLEVYPLECELELDLECTRGLYDGILAWIQTLLGILPTGVGLYNTVVVYRSVTQATRRVAQLQNQNNSNATSTVISNRRQQQRQERNAKVMRQCILYMASFMNSAFWPTFVAFVSRDRVRMDQAGGPFYILLFLTHLCLPLQGFLNWLIFKPSVMTHVHNRMQDWCLLNYMICCGSDEIFEEDDAYYDNGNRGVARMIHNARQNLEQESSMLHASCTTAHTRTMHDSSHSLHLNNNSSRRLGRPSWSRQMSDSNRHPSSARGSSLWSSADHTNGTDAAVFHNQSCSALDRLDEVVYKSTAELYSQTNNNKAASSMVENTHNNKHHNTTDDMDAQVDGGKPIPPLHHHNSGHTATATPLQAWMGEYNIPMEEGDELSAPSSLPNEINPDRVWAPTLSTRMSNLWQPSSSVDSSTLSYQIHHQNNNNKVPNDDDTSSGDISSLQMSAVEGKSPPREFPPLPLDLDLLTTTAAAAARLPPAARTTKATTSSSSHRGVDRSPVEPIDLEKTSAAAVTSLVPVTTKSKPPNRGVDSGKGGSPVDSFLHHHHVIDVNEEDDSMDNTSFASAVQRQSPSSSSSSSGTPSSSEASSSFACLELSPCQQKRMQELMQSDSSLSFSESPRQKARGKEEKAKPPPSLSWRNGMAPPPPMLPMLPKRYGGNDGDGNRSIERDYELFYNQM